MAKAKAKKAAREFDPRSDAVVLTYRGSEDGTPSLHGIPARDLTEADICRLVYQAGVTAYDGSELSPPMPDPERPDQAKCAAWVDLLLSRRVDGKSVYAASKAPAAASEPTPPAPPATQPEA